MEIKRKPRIFISEDLTINSWEDIKGYFESLLAEEINSSVEYKNWIKKNSELEAVLEEDMAWRYIKMTINTADEDAANSYKTFVTEINPKIAEQANELNKKLNDSPFKKELTDQADFIYLKKIETAIELFREENIPLQSETQTVAQEYSGIIGAQLITYKGEEITAQQAAKHLKDPDRAVRKEVYDLLYQRRIKDNDQLEGIFDKLVELRHQIAVNAGFENYRDYKFKSMNRFDYSVQDCFDFHKSIEQHIVPIYKKIQEEKLNKFGFDKFKPYDTSADPEGKEPLKPFDTGEDLLYKTI
jgi:oligoendopeptidase F